MHATDRSARGRAVRSARAKPAGRRRHPFARALEAAIRDAIKPIPLNIDGALAAILVDIGFPSLVGKLLFIIGRVAGMSAEVLEEHTREKPMRITIPVDYDGAPRARGLE